jgi:phosphoinositide-3-kinase regulatory subunit 4
LLSGFDLSNVLPFQSLHETPNAAYMTRQYLYSNLYDRLSTRPFLSNVEKVLCMMPPHPSLISSLSLLTQRWIVFQLIHAVAQCHERGVCHGDIKTENLLLTSWLWCYLVDFSSPYKPTFLPADNPADFSYFFDTGGRRSCYLAPERFFDHGSRPEGPLTPQMVS